MSNSTVVAPAKALVNASVASPATTPISSPPPAYLVPSASSPEGTLVIAKSQSSDISWITIAGVLIAFLVVAVITLIWFWYKKRAYKKALQEHRDLYEANGANFNRKGQVDEEQGIPSKTGQKILSDFERALASQSASKKFDGGDDGDDGTSGARIMEQDIPVYTRDKHVVEGFRKDSGGLRNKVIPGDFNWKQGENFSDELFYKGEQMGVRYSRAELGNIEFLTKIPSSEKVASKVRSSESESASLLGTLNRSHTIAASPAREERRKSGWKLRTLSLPAFHHRSWQGSRDTSVNMKGENRAESPRIVIVPLTPHPHSLPSSPSHSYSSTAFGNNLAAAPRARVTCWKPSRLSVQSNADLNNPTFIVPPSTPLPRLPLPATLGEAGEHGRILKESKKAESKWAIASYCPSTPPPPIPVPFLSPLVPPSQEYTQSPLLATSHTLSTSPSSLSPTLGADGSPSSGLSRANGNEGGDLPSQPPPPPPPPPPPLPTPSCRKFIILPAPDDPMKLTPPTSPPSNPHEKRKLTPPVSPECPQDGRKITPPPSPTPPPFPTLLRKSFTPPPSPPPPALPSSASKPKLAALILPGRPDLGADNVEDFRINRRSPKHPQKMRPLHWEKLTPESDKSMVWDNITNSMELDEEMIEHMFGVTTRASEDEGPKQSASTVTIEKAEILDPRKAHNIAIQLRARGLSRIEVRNALLEGEGLSQEILELLVKMAPTDEEMTKFQDYHGDPTLLGPADHFVQGILQIPSAFERLNAMLYRASFNEELIHLQYTITTLEMACKELKGSRTFTKLLEAVLKTGNRLNTGTFRGDAKAFKLDTLLKLADVKGVDGKTTLLHFLIKEIVKAEASRAARLAGFHDSSTPSSTWSSLCPSPTCTSPSSPLSHFARGLEAELNRCQSEISNSSSIDGFRRIGMDVVRGIPNELDHVRKAGGLDISTIRLGVSRLQTGLQDMKTTLEKLHEPSEGVGIGIRTTTYDLTDDEFRDTMAGFVEDAETKLSVIQKDLERVLASAKDISVYFYGEADTAKSTQPLKVFMVTRDFLAMLEQACKDVMKANAPLPPSTGPSRRNSLTLPL